jgi:hypothetical protein
MLRRRYALRRGLLGEDWISLAHVMMIAVEMRLAT